MELTAAQKKFILEIYDEDVSMTSSFECHPHERLTAVSLRNKGIVQFPTGGIEPNNGGYFEASLTDKGYEIAKEINQKLKEKGA